MGSEVSKWSDRAMFTAEPMEREEGKALTPRVYLLDPPSDPLGAVASSALMYEGRVIRDLSEVTDEQRRHYLDEMKKTKLQAPLEYIVFHFVLENVDRAMTHQIVRQRTAVYAQESLRFAVKENLVDEVILPPSLMGVALPEHESEQELLSMALSPEQDNLLLWNQTIQTISDVYNMLINRGMPAEEARGLMPHAVATRLHYQTNLRNLLDHAGNRLCTQAQFHWKLMFSQMVQAIRTAGQYLTYRSPEGPQSSAWQYELLTDDMFKPACFWAGHCPFEAQFDRHCNIRDRVRKFADHGVPPSKWEEPVRIDMGGWFETINPIRREEWLLDPAAARTR